MVSGSNRLPKSHPWRWSQSWGNPIPTALHIDSGARSNLSLRMGTRRCTQLTNAFSKKWENHWAAMSLRYTFYNFCRIHKALRVTPAMAAGIADRVWGFSDLLK